jgi:hypothetical protein
VIGGEDFHHQPACRADAARKSSTKAQPGTPPLRGTGKILLAGSPTSPSERYHYPPAHAGDRWPERLCVLRRFRPFPLHKDGSERWRLPLGPFNNVNGHGSSRSCTGFSDSGCDQDLFRLLAVDKDRTHPLENTEG